MPALAPSERSRATLERDPRPRRPGSLEARRLSQPQPRRASLDERISATWKSLAEDGSAECPVCAGEIRAGTGCRTCGSALS